MRALSERPNFKWGGPNRARLSTFPTVAARMVTVFSQWKDFAGERRGQMEAQLRRILAQEKLSKDTFENVQRCLA
jgi:hypothetical protein